MSLTNHLFDTAHLLESKAWMNLPEESYLEENELSAIELKTNEKIMCRNMVRKDFEMIRVHDSFLNLFSDAEFFSKANDDLLSIEHVTQIAFKRKEFQIKEQLYEYICDFGCQLAFNYINGEKSELENIKDNAAALVNLVFQASTFDSEQQAIQFFIKEIIKNYPHFNLDHAKRFLNELEFEIQREQYF